MTDQPIAGGAMLAAETGAEAVKDVCDAVGAAPQRLLTAQMETGAELLAFGSRRLRAQAALLGELCECRTVAALADAYRSFWTQAIGDYTEETARLAEAARRQTATLAAATPADGEAT